jgi:hypothetical protein
MHTDREEGCMMLSKLKDIFSKLTAFGTLILGLAALSPGNAQADTAVLQPTNAALEPSGRPAMKSDEVQVRIEGETIYISQDGGTFDELRLEDVAEIVHLKKLLRDAGAGAQSFSLPVGAMIVASGGGSGKGEKPKNQSSRKTSEPGKTK